MKSICVFCGSSIGSDKIFATTAKKVGELFAKENIGLVYGGGNVGLMGVIAQTMMESGARVTGIIPEFLMKKEHATLKVSKLIIVKSMHQRKAKMSKYSDGFYMLPGGLGTMEEFFEVWTWAQLDLHRKPIGVLNTNGYYNGLINFLDMAVKKGFIRKKDRNIIIVEKDPKNLLKSMQKEFVKNHRDGKLMEKS
jgi:uncharacterized protein (TIGR00730 family)